MPDLSGKTGAVGQADQYGDHAVHLFAGVIEGERGPHGGFHAETAQDGLRAMMTGTHRDAFLVEPVGLRSHVGLLLGGGVLGVHTGFQFGEPLLKFLNLL
jgi:hypothetical protein